MTLAECLAEGQKITLVYQGEFGGVTAIPTTYLGSRPAPHYQNCPASMVGVAIQHKPRGKRKAGYRTIAYNIPVVIYDGWKDIDVDSLVYKTLGVHMKESRYSMHDNRYFADLLAAWPDDVIFKHIPGGLNDE